MRNMSWFDHRLLEELLRGIFAAPSRAQSAGAAVSDHSPNANIGSDSLQFRPQSQRSVSHLPSPLKVQHSSFTNSVPLLIAASEATVGLRVS